MKKIIIPILLISSTYAYSQVGINTADPKASLDITAKNATGTTTNADGLLIPRVDRQRAQSMNGVETSTMIYVNNISTGSLTGTTINVDVVGYYYFNGTVWVKLNTPAGPVIDTNIYNTNGTLTGDRTVTQDDKRLAFISNAVNGFSVDGTTLSVDTQNNRIGIGTAAPNAPLQFANTGVNRKIVLFEEANNDHQFNGLGINSNMFRYQTASPDNDHAFFAGRNATTSVELMRIKGNGNVGIGTDNPSTRLEIASGTANASGLKLTNLTSASPVGTGKSIGVDAEGNVITITASNIYTADDTITSDRTVTQGTRRLAFTSNAVNGFSVDGDTFSIDTQNNRIGIGTTTPNGLLQFSNNDANRKIVFYEAANNDHQFYGFGNDATTLRYQIDSATSDHIFYSGINATSSKELMRVKGNGSVGIGANPNQSAALEVASTDKGFLLPRLTTTQRDGISSVPAGLTIYNTTTAEIQYWNGGSWVAI